MIDKEYKFEERLEYYGNFVESVTQCRQTKHGCCYNISQIGLLRQFHSIGNSNTCQRKEYNTKAAKFR